MQQITITLEKVEPITDLVDQGTMELRIHDLNIEEAMSMLINAYTSVAKKALVQHFDKHRGSCNCPAFKQHGEIMKYLSSIENYPPIPQEAESEN